MTRSNTVETQGLKVMESSIHCTSQPDFTYLCAPKTIRSSQLAVTISHFEKVNCQLQIAN